MTRVWEERSTATIFASGIEAGSPLEAKKRIASYQIARWGIINALFDAVLGGRAGWIQRLVSYGFIGGFAAVVNLAAFTLIYYKVSSPFGAGRSTDALWYVITFAIAAEISTMTNFVINDRVTFRHLPGHARSWAVRALRFHLTSLLGTLLTLAISFALAQAGLQAFMAEAVAIAIAFIFNFAVRHLFTYRHKTALQDATGDAGSAKGSFVVSAGQSSSQEMRPMVSAHASERRGEAGPTSWSGREELPHGMPVRSHSASSLEVATAIRPPTPRSGVTTSAGASRETPASDSALVLSVVIPAHNEEENIRPTVEKLVRTLDAERIKYEVLVVNDHSKDGTEAVLQALGQEYASVRYVTNQKQGGFGRAIQTGLENFRGDAVCIVMADASDDARDVVRYYRKLEEGYECVFGSRFMRESRVVDYPMHKFYINRLANWFINVLFRLGYNDTTNAFKAYRREVIAGVMPVLAQHFNITVELPLKAISRGYTYAVVPINWYNRTHGVSSLKIKEMGSRYLFIVLYIWLERMLSRGDYLRPQVKLVPTDPERLAAIAMYETMPHMAPPVRAEMSVSPNVIAASDQSFSQSPTHAGAYYSDRRADNGAGVAVEQTAMPPVGGLDTIPREKTSSPPTWVIALGVMALAWALIVSRRPDALFNAQFWAEDSIWYSQAYNLGPWRALLIPNAGYLSTLPRIAALIAMLVPLLYGPLVFNVIAIAAQMSPAVFLFSGRFDKLAPSPVVRALLAFLYIALPNSMEVNATVTNAQWHINILAFMIVVALPTKSAFGRLFDVTAIVLAGLSGPFCFVLVPIIVIRWLQTRSRYTAGLFLANAAASGVQAYYYLNSFSTRLRPDLGASPARLARLLAGQIFIGGTLGQHVYGHVVSSALWQDSDRPAYVVACVGLALYAIAAWRGSAELRLLILYGFMVYSSSLISPLVMASGTPAWVVIAAPSVGVRYAYLPMIVFMVVAVWFLTRRSHRIMQIVGVTILAITFLIGIPRDWQMPGYQDLQFGMYARQFDHLPSGASLTIPINPGGPWHMTLIKH